MSRRERLVLGDRADLRIRSNERRDFVAERLFKRGLDSPLERLDGCARRTKDDVAAGDERLDIPEAEPLEFLLECAHRDDAAADIDGSQKRDVTGHLCTHATSRSTGSPSKTDPTRACRC